MLKSCELFTMVCVRSPFRNTLGSGDEETQYGTVVEVYPKGGVEVEFVLGSGATQALLTLNEQDVRKIDAHDLLATRRLAKVT